MLTNNLEQLKKASREGYAIPAINTQGGNYDIIMGICKAAEEMRSPIILAHYVSTGAFSGHDWFVNVANGAPTRCRFPFPSIWTTATDSPSAWRRCAWASPR